MTERLRGAGWPAAIALCGVVLSLAACGLLRQAEERAAAGRLEYASLETFDDIAAVVQGDVEAAQAVAEHLDVTGAVSRAEFRALVAPALARHPTLLAIGWVPRVAGGDRGAVEAAARRDGLSAFRVGERIPEGSLGPAADRPEYFPILYVEPSAGSEGIFGFDMASEPVRRAALAAAAAGGDTVATPRVLLARDRGSRSGFLTFTPVYRRGSAPTTDSERDDSLVGYVFGATHASDLVNAVMAAPGRARLDIHVFDLSAAAGRRLYPDEGGGRLAAVRARTHVERPLRVGGRNWLLVSTPGEGYGQRRWRTSWLVLLAGLMLTGLAAAFAWVSASRNRARGLVEQAVRHERDFTRSVVDSLPGMFYVVGADGRFDLWNRTLEAMSGYAADEIAALSPEAFFAGEDRAAVAGAIARVFADGAAEVEAALATKGGSRIPCYFSGRRLEGEGGAKLIGMGIDISARKRAEEALRSSEQKLRALFDLSPLGLALNAMDGRFLDANRAFCDIVGYTAEQLAGLTYWDLTPLSYGEDEARQLDS